MALVYSRFSYLAIFCFLFLCHCRDNHESSSSDSNSIGKNSGDATYSGTATSAKLASRAVFESPGIAVKFDSRGNLTGRLTLRLDYLPTPKNEKATMPVCVPPMDSTEEVGFLRCTNPSNTKTVKILVSQIFQRCVMPSALKTTPALVSLVYSGCVEGLAVFHVFKPDLRFEYQPL